MEYIRYFGELGAALMAVIACPFLVVMLLRSYKIPQCYSCGAMKVRPSRVVGFWDSLCNAFGLRPYRCEGCQERIHAFLPFIPREPSAIQPAPPQRVVKLSVRLGHGLPQRVVIRVSEQADARPAVLQN